MTRTITHFVDGAAKPGTSGRTAPVMNPSTGQIQATVELAPTDEVNEVIANAEKAQVGWAKTNPQKRIRVIMKWISLWKAGPALAAGNAFVLKPSERDPSVPVRLAELVVDGRGKGATDSEFEGESLADGYFIQPIPHLRRLEGLRFR